MSLLSFPLCFRNIKNQKNHSFLCFSLPCFHRTLLFSFFSFFSFHSLKLWRIFNKHVNQPVKLLSPPILVDSTRFSLYAITEVSRKPKHTHFKSSLQNIHFLCAIFPRSPIGWGTSACVVQAYFSPSELLREANVRLPSSSKMEITLQDLPFDLDFFEAHCSS